MRSLLYLDKIGLVAEKVQTDGLSAKRCEENRLPELPGSSHGADQDSSATGAPADRFRGQQSTN